MERMSNREYDQQYRQHMDKVQRQAQYISDLLRYTSLQDQARNPPHRHYHSSHTSVPPPRHYPSYGDEDQVEDIVPQIVVPSKPSPKPLKPILRRTVSSNVTTHQQPTAIRKRPVSTTQASLKGQSLDKVAPNDLRRVRIQESHHIAYYPQDSLTDDEEDEDEDEEEEEEELYYNDRRQYQPTNNYQYQNESEDEVSESYSDEEELYDHPGQTWQRPALSQKQVVDRNPHRPTYPTSRLNEYLNSTAMHMVAPSTQQVYAGSEQSTPTSPSNNAVTSILERYFTTPNMPSMMSPLSSQDEPPSFQTSPRPPSFSSSTTTSNSSTSKGFLSSIFRKSPGPVPHTAGNIITTRAMAHRPNTKRNQLLSERDKAEIRELTKYEQLNGEPRSNTPAKDRKVMRVASMTQVWCFRIWPQQQSQQDEENLPVWTAFDYNNQSRLTKSAAANKECLFRDSHLQGDVMVLPAQNTGHVSGRVQRVMLEVRQLSVEPDTKFVYREGVSGTRWM